MTYRIQFTTGALRDLYALPERVAWAVLAFCEGALSTDPYRVGKALQRELAGLHSARRGEYRIVYRIDGETITIDVIRIRHRSGAYGRE